jgi:hypothetical protein
MQDHPRRRSVIDDNPVVGRAWFAALDAQRDLVGSGLAQRHRQVDRRALERRLDRPSDTAFARIDGEPEIRVAADMVEEWQLVFRTYR